MDASQITDWVEGYRRAWASNDPADIGRLFSDQAEYYTAPFRQPWRGRDAIVAGWIERQDAPGTYTFAYDVLGLFDDVGVVRGRTEYPGQKPPVYHNLWLIRLDKSGRCTSFTEWWMAEV
ncbi:MAG: YybH family protein [Candidatus Promineifilaceae bacterium]